MYFVHTDFYVSSMERSLGFYVTHLGFSVVEDTIVQGDLPSYVSNNSFDTLRLVLLNSAPGSACIELVQFQGEPRHPGFRIVPHQGTASFMVENLHELLARLRRVGIEPENRIASVILPHAGRSEIAFVRDPDGHPLEFIQLCGRGEA